MGVIFLTSDEIEDAADHAKQLQEAQTAPAAAAIDILTWKSWDPNQFNDID